MNSTLYIDKKIVIFESDDWGMLGMRDLDAFERLKAKGYHQLGEYNWDYYSLELPEDMEALYRVLSTHSDSFGLPPVFTCYFVVANPDYEKIKQAGYREFHILDLSQGFPGMWKNRENLLNSYKEGIKRGLIYPGYHGLCHFHYDAWLRALQNGERDVLDCIEEHVSYIPSLRADALCYDYLDESIQASFLSLEAQEERVKKGVEAFERIFGFPPAVTTAPRYAWNLDTEKIWHKYGINYIGAGNRQVGIESGIHHKLGENNQWGMPYLIRNVTFEPRRVNACQDAIAEIDFLFKAQQPAILETHSINFHSSIKNFREQSLERLDQLLYLIEKKYPDVVYLTSQQFGDILAKGHCYLRNEERMEVNIHRTNPIYLGKFYFHKKKSALKRYFKTRSK
ncbi:MAG: hypothetical protein NUV44_07455 [Candidatus Scalindua sp.]|nr:hypothetical protein [Candidatus Scalindua sp.]